jgi:acyl dehydratase
LLPDELKKFIGQIVDSGIFEIEKEPIRRFADAVGDYNPLFWDEEYARKSIYGSIIAPPGFLSSLWFTGRSVKWGPLERPSESLGSPELMNALTQAGYKKILDTGVDYEFSAVVKAGDVIKSSVVVKDIKERGGAVFLVTDTTWTNQDEIIVAKARSMTVHQ